MSLFVILSCRCVGSLLSVLCYLEDGDDLRRPVHHAVVEALVEGPHVLPANGELDAVRVLDALLPVVVQLLEVERPLPGLALQAEAADEGVEFLHDLGLLDGGAIDGLVIEVLLRVVLIHRCLSFSLYSILLIC